MRRVLVFLAVGILAAGIVYLTVRGGTGPEDNRAAREEQVETKPAAVVPLTEADRVRHELTAGLAFAPGLGFPGGVAWQPFHEIGSRGGVPLENLLAAHPLTFLQMCLDRYDREVEGYSLIFRKRERVAGKLYPAAKDKYETVEVHFREHPFSVYMNWLKEPKLAQRALYVEGENDNKVIARPRGLLGAIVVSRDVDSPDSKASGRYTINQFGLRLALQRTVDHMRKARDRGKLFVRYDGLVKLHEVGDRVCYKFVRTPYEPPEEDGVNELTVYIDRENWLQVGSVLRDADGQLIGEYFFSDIQLNPEFSEAQFTRDSV
jgi:hypothetical protein